MGSADNDTTNLPPFDPKALCSKCGWSIPDPPTPDPKFGPRDKEGNTPQLPQQPPEPPQPPTVQYCNGEECPWAEEGDDTVLDEHMHQFCDVCGHEWLSQPLHYSTP